MMDEMKGRFVRSLPTKVPDDAFREIAKATLKAKVLAHSRQSVLLRCPQAGGRLLHKVFCGGHFVLAVFVTNFPRHD